MLSRIAILVALIAGLAGYFGPWVWHPAVALRYSADDLAEFAKFMPAVRSGQAPITRELFFLPIWLASIGLALWLGSFGRRRWVSWLVGWVIVYAAIWPMPMYPFILDAYQSAEFSASFWGSVVAAALCVAMLLFGSRLPDRARSILWIVIGLAGGWIAPLTFVHLKPALDAQHGWALAVGWGIMATVIGFSIVGLSGLVGLIHRSRVELASSGIEPLR